MVDRRIRAGGGHFPSDRRGAALFPRTDPTRGTDADRLGLRPSPGFAKLHRLLVHRYCCMARRGGTIGWFPEHPQTRALSSGEEGRHSPRRREWWGSWTAWNSIFPAVSRSSRTSTSPSVAVRPRSSQDSRAWARAHKTIAGYVHSSQQNNWCGAAQEIVRVTIQSARVPPHISEFSCVRAIEVDAAKPLWKRWTERDA